MTATHISVDIATHISSGKDVTALLDTLNEDDFSSLDAVSASTSVVAAVDSFAAFIAKTPALNFIANTAIGASLTANAIKALDEINNENGSGAITNTTLLALGSNITDIVMLMFRASVVGNVPAVQIPLLALSTGLTVMSIYASDEDTNLVEGMASSINAVASLFDTNSEETQTAVDGLLDAYQIGDLDAGTQYIEDEFYTQEFSTEGAAIDYSDVSGQQLVDYLETLDANAQQSLLADLALLSAGGTETAVQVTQESDGSYVVSFSSDSSSNDNSSGEDIAYVPNFNLDLQSSIASALGQDSFVSDVQYQVQSGDTLSDIAQTYGTTVETLAAANNITDVNVIEAGANLVIPDQENAEYSIFSSGNTDYLNSFYGSSNIFLDGDSALVNLSDTGGFNLDAIEQNLSGSDVFSNLGTTNYLDDYRFDIDTNFSYGNQELGVGVSDELLDLIRDNGLLYTSGNASVSSFTANTGGFFTELNAAISDDNQPGLLI
jgi:LysM repeat protein